MGSTSTKKALVLFSFVISASLFSISFAGRASKFVDCRLTGRTRVAPTEEISEGTVNDFEGMKLHQRMLKVVRTNDYGNYDPTPAFDNPPFKLIPNWRALHSPEARN